MRYPNLQHIARYLCDTPGKQALKSFAILSLKVSRDMKSIAAGPLRDREPLRGKSASERVSDRTSEREGFRGFQSFSEFFFSEIFRDSQRFFRGPLRDPLRGRSPPQRLSVLLPLIVLPLELSPKDTYTFSTYPPKSPILGAQKKVYVPHFLGKNATKGPT